MVREQHIAIVPGVSDVAILAGATLGPIGLTFDRPAFVTGIFFAPRSAVVADAAALRLRITDEEAREMFYDSDQSAVGGAPGLVMGPRLLTPAWLWPNPCPSFWYPIQRPVFDGDVWLISVVNGSAGPITPIMGFSFEEARAAA